MSKIESCYWAGSKACASLKLTSKIRELQGLVRELVNAADTMKISDWQELKKRCDQALEETL